MYKSEENEIKNIILNSNASGSNVIAPDFGFDWDVICLIRPYQDTVTSDSYSASFVNEYLKKDNLKNDEEQFLILFIDGKNVKRFAIQRGHGLEPADSNLSNVDKLYRQVSCAKKEFAVLIVKKSKDNNFKYFDIIEERR